MGEHSGDGPLVVLVAVDGSETSMRAGAYAAGLARREGSRLVCLYVRFGGALAATAAAAAVQETMNLVSSEIRQLVETESVRLGIDAEFVDREGNPFTEIVKLADELHADAVVVGASMKAGHRLVGSLAVHLVRVAHWPVTVVP